MPYQYIVLMPDHRMVDRRLQPGQHSKTEGVDAAAATAAWVATQLNDYAFSVALEKELDRLKPQIVGKLPPGGGALISVTFVENTDFGYRRLNSTYIYGVGPDMWIVLNK